jgi:hypothetical protein
MLTATLILQTHGSLQSLERREVVANLSILENLLPGVQELHHEAYSDADTNSGDKTRRLTAMGDGIQSGTLKS